MIARGEKLALNGEWTDSVATSCTDCHDTLGEDFAATGDGNGSYPDIAEYLSSDWLKAFIADPGTEQFYGDRNHMPAYAEKLTEEELDLLVRWFTGDFMKTEIQDYGQSTKH